MGRVVAVSAARSRRVWGRRSEGRCFLVEGQMGGEFLMGMFGGGAFASKGGWGGGGGGAFILKK